VAALPEVFRETTPALPAEYFDELLASARGTLIVAEEEARIVGFAVCETRWARSSSMLVPQITAVIEQIVVTKAMRGQGIGQALFDGCAVWAKGNGAAVLTLQVWEFNADAIAFYERRGMTTMHRQMVLPLA
jgi:ribosomal protein S18 acetylase RimI-like enzyme